MRPASSAVHPHLPAAQRGSVFGLKCKATSHCKQEIILDRSGGPAAAFGALGDQLGLLLVVGPLIATATASWRGRPGLSAPTPAAACLAIWLPGCLGR